MAVVTGISWTDATFNPWWGCWPVSPGCALCYAARDAERYGWREGGGSGPDLWKEKGPRRTFGEGHWSGKNSPRAWARTLPEKLGRRPRVFCASMADIGEDHPVADQERPKLWRLVEDTPELDWLLLTKRVKTARQWLPAEWLKPGGWPANAWFMFSAEDQQRFDERLPYALDIPAGVIGCSYEPALGPIDLRAALSIAWQCSFCQRYFPDPYCKTCPACSRDLGWSGSHKFNPPHGQRGPGLSWVIAGGESGSRARPSHPDWFRSARDQCVAAGIPFHLKQWGEFGPAYSPDTAWPNGALRGCSDDPDGFTRMALPDGTVTGVDWNGGAGPHLEGATPLLRMGKIAAGRKLDGRTWDEFPESAA